jgi:hypothetical protein
VTRRLPGLLLLLLCASCSRAAGDVLTSEEYARVLTRTAQRLEQAAGRGAAGRAEAEQALDSLPQQVTVLGEPGQPAREARNADLVASLRQRVEAGPMGWREAGQVLRNVGRSAATRAAPPPPEASRVLAGVLAGREFREPWWEKTVQRFWLWVAGLLERIAKYLHFPNLGVHVPRRVWNAIGVGLVVLLAGAVIVLLARVLARMTGPLTDLPPPPRVRQIEIRSSARWRAEAERAVEARDYRAAVRALHLAALMRLDEAGMVHFDDGCSDGRFVRLLRDHGQADLARHLSQLNRLFAVIWYGLAPAGPEEYAAAQALLTDLEAVTTS